MVHLPADPRTTILYAIDPGKTGAIARFVESALTEILDPVDARLSALLADRLVDDMGDSANRVEVVIEQVNGLPGQSGPAAFNFGAGYGELLGVCLALGVSPSLVRPHIWKAGLGLRNDTKNAREFKAKSVALAKATWPHVNWFERAKDDGRAEAALLGHFHLTQGLMA